MSSDLVEVEAVVVDDGIVVAGVDASIASNNLCGRYKMQNNRDQNRDKHANFDYERNG